MRRGVLDTDTITAEHRRLREERSSRKKSKSFALTQGEASATEHERDRMKRSFGTREPPGRFMAEDWFAQPTLIDAEM